MLEGKNIYLKQGIDATFTCGADVWEDISILDASGRYIGILNFFSLDRYTFSVEVSEIGSGDASEQAFSLLEESEKAGLVNLKGHHLRGGLRASIYNAMPEAGVDTLIDFMQNF